jgi:hypothetical protein
MRSASACCDAIAFSFARIDGETVGIAGSDASTHAGSKYNCGTGSERDCDAGPKRNRDTGSERDCYTDSERGRDTGFDRGSEAVSARGNSRSPILGGRNEAYSSLFSVWFH